MANYKVISFDRIPSTQDYAHELISLGRDVDCTVVWALAQSAGRGRYRRRWVSRHGNLYVSFIFEYPERDARLSYAIAVAIAETIAFFGADPKIKWPNDILVDSKKIAGVLIEYSGPYVIVGVGINVKTCPTVPEYKTTKLSKYSNVSINELLNRLMRNTEKWRDIDFAVVRERWMSFAACLDCDVVYQGNSARLIGINEKGALILRCGTRYLLVYGDEITMH